MPLTEPTKLTLAKDFTWNETVWNPSMIQTALWLDASDNTTVFSDAGITQAVAGSSTVQQWNDKSSNNRHVSQSTSSLRPAYAQSLINNQNALTFITDDFLARSSPGLVTGGLARSMFVVYKPNTTGSNSNWICGQAHSGTDTNSWFGLMHRNDSVKGDPYFATYAADITDSTAPTTDAKIGSVVYDGTTVFLYRNGTQIATAARALVTNANVSFFIGRDSSASFMNGSVAEIVFTENAINTVNRQRLEGYLAHKWGLTASLPAGHPYKTVGPTP